MNRTSKRWAQRAVAFPIAMTTVGAMFTAFTATSAFADVTQLTVDQPSKAQQMPADNSGGSTATINFTFTRDSNTDTTPVRFIVESGPDAGEAGSSAGVAPFACTAPLGSGQHNGSCTVTHNNTTAGTDTVRVYGDNNNNNQWDAGEPNDTATIQWFGVPTSITISPTSDTASTGTCNFFTVTAKDAANQPANGAEIDVDFSQAVSGNSTATGSNTGNPHLSFCTTGNANSTNPQPAGTAVGNSQPSTNTYDAGSNSTTTTIHGRFTADSNGQVIFGVMSDTPGPATIRAYYNTDGSVTGSAGPGCDPNATANCYPSYTAGDPNAVANKTFTAGGQDAVKSVTASPATATNPINTQHSITVTTFNGTNGGGDTVSGVTVSAKVTAGPNTGMNVACPAPTDNSGKTTCSYTSTKVGTDTITIWVNQTGGNTTGPDAGEPQTTVTKNWVAGQANAISLNCTQNATYVGSPAQSGTQCINPTDQSTETFTASVQAPTGPNNNQQPLGGATVNFTITGYHNGTQNNNSPAAGSASDATLNPTSCVTAADGTCSVTLTNPSPVDGDSVTVTANTLSPNGSITSNSATKSWQARYVYQVQAVPAEATNQVGTNHTAVALVTDQFGKGVSGDTVTFNTDPNSRNYPVTGTGVTDNTGKASFTYHDNATNPTANQNCNNAGVTPTGTPGGCDIITISATYSAANTSANQIGTTPGTTSDTQYKRWINEAPTAAAVAINLGGGCASYGNPPTYTVNGQQKTDTNTVGGVENVCATVRSAGGDPIPGTQVTFTVDKGQLIDPATGKTVGTTFTATVDDNGNAFVDTTDNTAEVQTVTATANGHSDSGTVTWQANAARNVDCTPKTASNPAGTNHIVTCTVKDRFGNPAPGAGISFSLTGVGRFNDPNCFFGGGGQSCFMTTGTDGKASVQITSSTAGSTTITGNINTGPNECNNAAGAPAGSTQGNCTDTVSKTWTNNAAGTIDVTAPNGNVGATETVTAVVKNSGGTPLQDVTVRFQVTGANSASGAAVTDANGVARFTYTPANKGTDTAVAFADMNNDGLRQSNEPQGTASYTIGAQQTSAAASMPAYKTGSLIVLGDQTGKIVSSLHFGNSGDIPLWGDWNGDGTSTVGVFRPSTHTFYLSNDNHTAAIVVSLGSRGDTPLTGDFDGNGTDTIGVYRPSTATFYTTNNNHTVGSKFHYGNIGDVPLVGDWDKSGQSRVGVYRPSTETFYRINFAGIHFGSRGDQPIVGDWDGNGTTTLGVVRGNQWFLSNNNSTAQFQFTFGPSNAAHFTWAQGESPAAPTEA